MPSGVTVSRRIGLSADASPPGCGDARAAFRDALAAAPWQRSPGSRFVRLRSRRPRTVNGCIRWLPEVAIIPPWSPAGASRPGSPCVRGCSPGSRPPARGSAGAHLDAASSDGADMRLPVDARCVSVRTRRLSAAAHTRISCPAGRVPRACGTLVASRSRETGRGAAAPLRDVRAARPIRITSRFPGRRPSPAPSCGRSPYRSRARAVCRPS